MIISNCRKCTKSCRPARTWVETKQQDIFHSCSVPCALQALRTGVYPFLGCTKSTHKKDMRTHQPEPCFSPYAALRHASVWVTGGMSVGYREHACGSQGAWVWVTGSMRVGHREHECGLQRLDPPHTLSPLWYPVGCIQAQPPS